MHKPRLSSLFNHLSLKHLVILVLILIFVMIGLLVGYFIGFNQLQGELEKERKQTQLLMKQIKNIAITDDKSPLVDQKIEDKKQAEIEALKKQLREILAHNVVEAHHEYAPKDKKALPPPAEKREPKPVQSGAKLVIIIDDVSYAHDVAAIRSTGLPLVMSFLPPTSRHPDSAILAKEVGEYMVHLPLEAVAFNGEEPNTLRVNDSLETINKQIELVKKLYPGVRYVNNHTGSKFTADREAVDRLVQSMRANGLILVDSRTTGQSKIKEISQKYGLRYLGRDVFLDHHDGVGNIKKQIREAVRIAKRHGSAIAIGHPRPDTIEALKQSKAILGEVKLVRIDQI